MQDLQMVFIKLYVIFKKINSYNISNTIVSSTIKSFIILANSF